MRHQLPAELSFHSNVWKAKDETLCARGRVCALSFSSSGTFTGAASARPVGGPQLLRGSRSLRAPLFNPLYSQTVGTIETLTSLGCAFAQRTLFCKMLSSHHHVTSVSIRPARGRLSSFYFRPRSPRELILVVKPLNQTKPACFLSDKA